MIFQHTWEKVLSGEKVQTRRIALPEPDGTGDYPCEMIAWPMGIMAVQRIKPCQDRWRIIYQVGKTYAVQPGRGKPAVARIQITDIRREDVRNISDGDAKAEGFDSVPSFYFVWASIHDKAYVKAIATLNPADTWIPSIHGPWGAGLSRRPAALYDAWVLTFKLVQP